MVTKSEPKIEEGVELLKELDKQMKIEVAMWFYIAESNIWRFIVGSSLFNNKSGQDIYADFVDKFKDIEQVKNIGLENITLLASNNNLVTLFKSAIKTGPTDIGGIRFTSNVINGVLIEDAYIYRLS
jgi:hypothetical protein